MIDPLLNLLSYKAWGDQELMVCVCENHRLAPDEVFHKALRVMNHIHVVDRIFVAHLSGQSHSFTSTNTSDTPSPETLSWNMQETDRKLTDLLRALKPQELHQQVHFRFTDGDGASMSPAEMVMHVCLHSTYHRGQVGQMLKDVGIAPPRELLTRQLHTQEPHRR